MIQPPCESEDEQGSSERSSAPTMLKVLLRERHLQSYSMFKRAYQKAARGLDKDLVEMYPTARTLRRWQAGRIKDLPRAEHCAVLEAIFPGWTAADLFKPYVVPGDVAGSTLLQELLRRRYLHCYRDFCRAYNITAATIDQSLVGTHPAERQFYRWISGEMVGLPYPDHCNVLEAMFPGYSARQFFEPYRDDSLMPDEANAVIGEEAPEAPAEQFAITDKRKSSSGQISEVRAAVDLVRDGDDDQLIREPTLLKALLRSQERVVPNVFHSFSDLDTLLDDAIAESTELSAATEATSLGSVGMEQLQADVKSFSSALLHTSASRTATIVIVARRRVFRFLCNAHTPIQAIQLYFLAGQLSGLLSHACKDLGRYDAAATHARTAWACGESIQHDGLSAWACGLQAISAYWSGQPSSAIKFADTGLKYAAVGTTASWLHGVRARSFGKLRDKRSLRDALSRAWDVRDESMENDLCDLLRGASGFGPEKLHYYSANALASAGEASCAISEGSRALELYDTAEPTRRSVAAAATVRIDMSIIMLRQHKFAEAVTTLRPVLSIGLDHRNAGLRQQLRRVRHELVTPQNNSFLVHDVTADIDTFLAAQMPASDRTATTGPDA